MSGVLEKATLPLTGGQENWRPNVLQTIARLEWMNTAQEMAGWQFYYLNEYIQDSETLD